MTFSVALIVVSVLVHMIACQKIIVSNDDGWAVAQIRAQTDALVAAGFDVVLSAPAEQESGTGSSSATPTVLTEPCELNTCPVGSPAEGFNATNPRLNYVNSFPVDSARFGIQTLAPKFFNSPPDFLVSGPNVGNNLGTVVTGSGTVGAACEAAKEGIPSTAFSGDSTSQVSYTTLESSPSSTATIAARLYSNLTVKFTQALLSSPSRPILPANITLNVNYPSTSGCSSVEDYSFIFTRLVSNSSATDVETCGTDHLPDEGSVVGGSGCFVSVSVMNATTKKDVNAGTQGVVLDRLGDILTCLPN